MTSPPFPRRASESSPVAPALAGLRANEARYITNKYGEAFAVAPAAEEPETLEWVNGILAEKDLVIASRPLEQPHSRRTAFGSRTCSTSPGSALNVMYTIADAGKRAVGLKLSEGMEIPEELASRFKFARQKSKLAGVIRGSYFVIKGEH